MSDPSEIRLLKEWNEKERSSNATGGNETNITTTTFILEEKEPSPLKFWLTVALIVLLV